MPIAAPCPVVVTIHDMTMFLYPELHVPAKRIFFPQMIRWSARHAAQLLSVSASTRDDFCRILSVPNERVVVTPLGVSPDFFPPVSGDKRAEIAARYQLPEQYILYVGLIEPRKNVPLLLEAYARLCQQRDVSHKLVIGGRMGWASSEILPLVDQLGIKERVIFTGYIAQEDLPGVFQMADIFVYPSIYEGFGFPVLEGLASGVPVITTRVSSMPEVAGDAAILIPPNDGPALTSAMDKILSDPQLTAQLKTAGPIQAQSYTWERTARLTWEAYQSIRRGKHV